MQVRAVLVSEDAKPETRLALELPRLSSLADSLGEEVFIAQVVEAYCRYYGFYRHDLHHSYNCYYLVLALLKLLL